MSFWKNIMGKAVQSYSGSASSIYPQLPQVMKLTDDPRKLISFNRGYVAAANNKISGGVANLPYHLYAVVDDNKVNKLYTPHKALTKTQSKAITASNTNIATASRNRKTVVEIYEHPFLDLMKKPSKGWTQTEFFYIISSYLGILGNSYLEKVYNGKTLTELKPMLSEYMAITYDANGDITKYDLNPSNGITPKSYTPDQVLHIKNRCAGSVISGRGDLENCLQAVLTSNSAYAYATALLNNMAIPGGMITFDNITVPEGVDPQLYMKEIEDEALCRFGGNNRGKPFVTFGKTSWTKMDTNMADTKIDVFVDGAKKEIAAAFGVPVSMLDDSDANRATAYASIRSLKTYGVLPKAGLILDQLNYVIQEEYDPNLYMWYDPNEALDNDPVEQSTVLTSYTNAGIMSINEARKSIGLESVEGGDSTTTSVAGAV